MKAEIEHVHFLCAEPDRTAGFFRTYFDAEEIDRVTLPDWLIIRLRVGGTTIALSPRRGDQVLADPPTAPHRGFAHIGLKVPDIAGLIERMRGDGVDITVEPFDIAPNMRGAYVLAPDGIELELLQPVQAS